MKDAVTEHGQIIVGEQIAFGHRRWDGQIGIARLQSKRNIRFTILVLADTRIDHVLLIFEIKYVDLVFSFHNKEEEEANTVIKLVRACGVKVCKKQQLNYYVPLHCALMHLCILN